jgi:hypothetical protein
MAVVRTKNIVATYTGIRVSQERVTIDCGGIEVDDLIAGLRLLEQSTTNKAILAHMTNEPQEEGAALRVMRCRSLIKQLSER